MIITLLRRLTERVSPLVLIYSVITIGGTVDAQQANSAQQTVQSTNVGPGAIDQSLLPKSNSDLGELEIVSRQPKPDIFSASTTQSYLFTSNALLSDTHNQESSAYHGNYKANIIPYSTVNWTPFISAQYDMYRYDQVSQADFDEESATIASPYYFTNDAAWSWTPAVSVSRFTSPHLAISEFYKEVAYTNRVTHTQKLLQLQPLYLSSTYELTYRQSDPSAYSRVDNSITEVLSYLITPQLTFQAYFRPAAYIYPNSLNGYYSGSRTDFNVTSGIMVNYQPSKYFSLNASFTNIENFSSQRNFNYSSVSPGVALSGSYSF